MKTSANQKRSRKTEDAQKRRLQRVVSLRWCYLEEYHKCGCSFIAAKRRDLMGYCGRHGNDRKRVTKLPDKFTQHGYAG